MTKMCQSSLPVQNPCLNGWVRSNSMHKRAYLARLRLAVQLSIWRGGRSYCCKMLEEKSGVVDWSMGEKLGVEDMLKLLTCQQTKEIKGAPLNQKTAINVPPPKQPIDAWNKDLHRTVKAFIMLTSGTKLSYWMKYVGTLKHHDVMFWNVFIKKESQQNTFWARFWKPLSSSSFSLTTVYLFGDRTYTDDLEQLPTKPSSIFPFQSSTGRWCNLIHVAAEDKRVETGWKKAC